MQNHAHVEAVAGSDRSQGDQPEFNLQAGLSENYWKKTIERHLGMWAPTPFLSRPMRQNAPLDLSCPRPLQPNAWFGEQGA